MNWVDLAVLGVVVVSALFGLLRGFVRESLGVIAWVLAAVAASPYGAFPYTQPIARQHIADPGIADAVAFGAVFIVVLAILLLVAGIISRVVRRSMLGSLDRTLGLAFGVVRGAVLIASAYIIAGFAFPIEQWPAPVLEARSLPLVYRGAELIAAQVPPGYKPAVASPPVGRPTTSAELMPITPAGRALGSRAARE